MKSNFETATNTNSFFLDDIKLLADRIVRLWTQPIRKSSEILMEKANEKYKLRQG